MRLGYGSILGAEEETNAMVLAYSRRSKELVLSGYNTVNMHIFMLSILVYVILRSSGTCSDSRN